MSVDLVADIGGTNARFALCNAHGKLEHMDTLPTRDYPTLVEAIKAYLARYHAEVHHAAIAIANPVMGDWVQMTNHHWSFSIRETQQTLGWQSLAVINDFTAQALAVLDLSEEERHVISPGEAVANSPIAVIGPGTGLGVSGLVPDGRGHWIPLAGEGGHVSLPIREDSEFALWQYAHSHFPGHVSAERLISGAGLTLIDQALASFAGKSETREPAEITTAALYGEDRAIRTLNIFGALLGDVAGNLALTLGARGGVYLCGGILPRVLALFEQGPFVQRFSSKGRMSAFLQGVPVYLVMAGDTGLRGAAKALHRA